jgi:hypothetical protein
MTDGRLTAWELDRARPVAIAAPEREWDSCCMLDVPENTVFGLDKSKRLVRTPVPPTGETLILHAAALAVDAMSCWSSPYYDYAANWQGSRMLRGSAEVRCAPARPAPAHSGPEAARACLTSVSAYLQTREKSEHFRDLKTACAAEATRSGEPALAAIADALALAGNDLDNARRLLRPAAARSAIAATTLAMLLKPDSAETNELLARAAAAGEPHALAHLGWRKIESAPADLDGARKLFAAAGALASAQAGLAWLAEREPGLDSLKRAIVYYEKASRLWRQIDGERQALETDERRAALAAGLGAEELASLMREAWSGTR